MEQKIQFDISPITDFQEGGMLLVDKPLGWTSFDVVAKIRSQIKQVSGIKKPKVGHTGTLDPLATGLMIVVVGKWCRRAEEFSKLDKIYEVELKLGATSTTGDSEGEISLVNKTPVPESDFEKAALSFVGEIEQIPPMYSAIKVDGKRAYELARAGKIVELKARKVTIFEISNISCSYPSARFTVHVSSGTYIRSLVEDIGKKLGTGAYVTALRRTKVGAYSL